MSLSTIIMVSAVSILVGGFAFIYNVQTRQIQNARLTLTRLKTHLKMREEQYIKTEEAVTKLSAEKLQLERERVGLQSRLDEREKNLESMKSRIDDELSVQTTKIFEQAHHSFLERAKEVFDQHQKIDELHDQAKQDAFLSAITPLQQNLLRYEENLSAFRNEQSKNRGAISAQISDLARASQDVRMEAQKLTTALRAGPKTRGRWGEEQLRNVIELAGMQAHVDFVEQSSHLHDAKRLQPDVVIRLPGERFIVIDSKVSLGAYLDAMEASDPDVYQRHIATHTKHIQNHISALSSRDYANNIHDGRNESLDFVILFLPAESFFSTAIEHRPSLFQEAFEKKVLIATPTTLIAILKAISLGWRQENANRNADNIAKLAKDIYANLGAMSDNLAGLGRSIDTVIKRYNLTTNNFERQLLPCADKFADFEMPGLERKLAAPPAISQSTQLGRSSLDKACSAQKI